MKNITELEKKATHKVRYTDCDGDNNIYMKLDTNELAELIILKCVELAENNENILEYFDINKK